MYLSIIIMTKLRNIVWFRIKVRNNEFEYITYIYTDVYKIQ